MSEIGALLSEIGVFIVFFLLGMVAVANLTVAVAVWQWLWISGSGSGAVVVRRKKIGRI
jgi:hypothetical protein